MIPNLKDVLNIAEYTIYTMRQRWETYKDIWIEMWTSKQNVAQRYAKIKKRVDRLYINLEKNENT